MLLLLLSLFLLLFYPLSLYDNSTCRDGIDEVFDVLEKNEVPLVIFSAGVGGESIVGN